MQGLCMTAWSKRAAIARTGSRKRAHQHVVREVHAPCARARRAAGSALAGHALAALVAGARLARALARLALQLGQRALCLLQRAPQPALLLLLLA